MAKPRSEMSRKELADASQKWTGLPVPPLGAPRETMNQWAVSQMFLLHLGSMPDPVAAKVEATNCLLSHPDALHFIPYVERVIGRKFTPEEIEAGRIASLEAPLSKEAAALLS